MRTYWIRGGQVPNFTTAELEQCDILIEDGIVTRMERAIDDSTIPREYTIIDATNKLVSPGLIDLHVHLREPGFEYKETVATGTLAAARGGFTAIACMPNTRPIIDSVESLASLQQVIARDAHVRVLPIAAITMGELGDALTDMEALKEAGAFAFSDDGVGVQSSQTMLTAMQKAQALGMAIVAHTEDNSLAHGGSVHDGVFAAQHGLKGIPPEAESVQVARDVLLAESSGVHYHVCHISAEQSVHHVRMGKARGVRVSAEVTPHHLLLTDEDIPGLDTNYKMNPPLRSARDREALLAGLRDGTIDFIATDHAPHSSEEKGRGMAQSPFGIVGLETAFPLMYTHLVANGHLSLVDLIHKMSTAPALLFGLPWGTIAVGRSADITIIDLDMEKAIDPATFASKGRNTPFAGWVCKGWPIATIVAGKMVWQAE